MVPRLLSGVVERRLRDRRIAQLPELVDVFARELRAGANLHAAISAAAADWSTTGSGLAEVVARTASGERLVDAIDRWAAAFDHPDADLIRAVLNLGAGTGGALAGALERAAVTLRERAGLRDEVRALTAQTRVSASMLAVAPVGFLVLVMSIDPANAAVMVRTGLGRACLVTGLMLDAVGLVWMRRLVVVAAR